jgi:hypothetical protein
VSYLDWTGLVLQSWVSSRSRSCWPRRWCPYPASALRGRARDSVLHWQVRRHSVAGGYTPFPNHIRHIRKNVHAAPARSRWPARRSRTASQALPTVHCQALSAPRSRNGARGAVLFGSAFPGGPALCSVAVCSRLPIPELIDRRFSAPCERWTNFTIGECARSTRALSRWPARRSRTARRFPLCTVRLCPHPAAGTAPACAGRRLVWQRVRRAPFGLAARFPVGLRCSEEHPQHRRM